MTPLDPSELEYLLGLATERSHNDRRFNSTAGLDTPPPARQRRTKRDAPSLVIPETLDGAQMGAFLVALGRRHPRKMRRILRDMEWLRRQGRKAAVW